MRVLITGGAGFVGSSIALAMKERLDCQVLVLDNLRRRGSETNLAVLGEKGIRFLHGDIRLHGDLEDLPGNFDLLIEASAEPSVHAGQSGSPGYVIGTNLIGTLNCLEFARKRAGAFLFLSTSRVYSIAPLRSIRLEEKDLRFELAQEQFQSGVSMNGIAEDFPTDRPRSFYGATKLASELLLQEYVETFGVRGIIDRCSVITGPGQFGRQDQGVFALWVACHHFGIPLSYTGFGGLGKQVRDLLHPMDLAELLSRQIDESDRWQGDVYNVGGGCGISVSLREMTALCREIVGRETKITGVDETAAIDIPFYVSDNNKACSKFGWQPKRGLRTIVSDTARWIHSNEELLKPIFADKAF